MIELNEHQLEAVKKLKCGNILCGGVGSGKSRTALYYYFRLNGGGIDEEGNYIPMKDPPQDLYIITTARKRDTLEWEEEMLPFLLYSDDDTNLYSNKVVVDSWNNIKKYADIEDSFIIFDEQRVVGKGEWVKTFLRITKPERNNHWILLSATPGDTWMDYVPVFIANGFFKNRTDFNSQHVVYSPHSNFPKVDRYINTGRLIRLRNKILVDLDCDKTAVAHHEDVFVMYDYAKYKELNKTRWDPWKEEPMQSASDLCYCLRRVVNTHQSRQDAVMDIFKRHPRAIIFYNFDYELEILKNLPWEKSVKVSEWNGHKHQEIPESKSWVYFVQYTAGAEGWNCIKTDTIIFYSQNYSYKVLVQASGRIDRLNTPFTDLYYYHLKSRSGIDLAISRALNKKKAFNEKKFVGDF